MAPALGTSHETVSPHLRSASGLLVIVVAHNGRGYLGDCLDSLQASGTDASQIVVVDNHSADGSAAFVEAEFPEITVLLSDANLGYGGATNVAIREAAKRTDWASIEFVAVLNQDVVSGPNWIDELVAALGSDDTVALATPKVLLRNNPHVVNACGNSVHLTGITTCRGWGRLGSEFTRGTEIAAVSGAAFVARKSVFEAVLGGFDPLFFLYLEDTDLSLRAALAGFRAIYVPDAVVYHDFQPAFGTAKIHWLERNRIMLLVKIFRWRSLLLLLPALVLTELLVLGYALAQGVDTVGAKLHAYLWLLRHAREIGKARQKTQRGRRISDRELLALLTSKLDVRELDHRLAGPSALIANWLYRAWWTIARPLITW